MNLDLENKIVIVTGGAKGIGEGIVRSFAAEGAIPVIFDRNPDVARALLEDIGGAGHAISTELTDEGVIRDAVAETVEKFGQIDVVVNNAGVNDGVGLDQSPDAFLESLRKNLFHVFALVHFALPELKKTRGSIINIGSKVAATGQGNTSGYAASKGGMNGLTREWAVDLAPFGIRTNCICPAEVMTPLYEKWLATLDDPEETKRRIEFTIPLGQRFTTSEEIADLAVFLASNRSGHTTGQIFYPDGGYTHLDRKATMP
ncbi:MAG: SDR family oxidoreductase [Verrucomicrobiales bacterium]|nr:SDR family oxidoreductase [Verrucomicrobiales bacterium]